MAAGYKLKEGYYDNSHKSMRDIEGVFYCFFNNYSNKTSTYKYAMLKAILDNLSTVSDKTYEISFDSLFFRFSEIYWVLVFNYKIPQKVTTAKVSETNAEKIVQEVAIHNNIKSNTAYDELSDQIRYEMMTRMKKECSNYVFGALYAETSQLLYSFSKKEQWIRINPQVFEYVSQNLNTIQMNNYQAWARFYTDIVLLDKDDSYYQKLLSTEFGDNYVMLCSNENSVFNKSKSISSESKGISYVYDAVVSNNVRMILKQYPDIGLYVAQVSDKIGENKDIVRDILDNSFWSKKEGSRYYYKDITDEDIINDAIFTVDDISDSISGINDSISKVEEVEEEYDAELLKMLDDPELLIKKLKLKDSMKSGEFIKKKKEEKNISQNLESVAKSINRNWDREEVVILVVEYFRTKKSSTDVINESIKAISEFLRKREKIITGLSVDDTFRNIAGIRMQMGRIMCLDPDTKYTGMKGTILQQEIVHEYLTNSEALINEANQIYDKYK